MKKINEENACNAFIEIFYLLTGEAYDKTDCPDERNSPEPEVDFILRPRNAELPLLAVEHTILESFEGQIKYVKQSHELVQEVNVECQGKLPMDRYFELVLPSPLVESLEKSAKAKFIKDISPWVISEAQGMKRDDYISRHYGNHKFLLICGGSHPDVNGSVGRMPGEPDKLTELKDDRLWIAFCHGLDKFPKYKDAGYDTVLLLEDVSGIHGSPDFGDDDIGKSRLNMISALVDYVVVFISHRNKMIVGNIWKNKQNWYKEIPYSMRFNDENGKWKCLAECVKPNETLPS